MRDYVLIKGDGNDYWYGYYEDTSNYWSYWTDSIDIALSSNLNLDDGIESGDRSFKEFCELLPENNAIILLHSNEPITFDYIQQFYPELLL